MNLKTFLKYKLIIVNIIILIILLVLIILNYKSSYNEKVTTDNIPPATTDVDDYSLHSEDFSKYDCNSISNGDWTECMIEKLDRAASEREWKQRKLEKIKLSEVNEFNMALKLSREVLKIRKWRETFEVGRDAWCEAENAFNAGSGTPGQIAQCKFELEIKAIKILNSLHYDVIINFQSGAGIKDFEPKESDIDSIVKTNKTTRGCVWAGDDECK